LALYRLFIGRFQGNIQVIICSCPSTDVSRFVEKYPPPQKYAISDRPHMVMHLCETYFIITEWIALKLENSH
jgi:hypothetical protein